MKFPSSSNLPDGVPLANLKLPAFTAIIDTREQLPLKLIHQGQPLRSMRGTLKTGDYSILGLQDKICIERKGFMDLLACIGGHRRRFEECLDRMLEIPMRMIVVEGSWKMLEQVGVASQWRSHLHPNAAIGSVLSWIAKGVPVLMLDNPERASDYVSRLLVYGYKRFGPVEVTDEKELVAVPDPDVDPFYLATGEGK